MIERLERVATSVDELSVEVATLRDAHRKNTSALWGAVLVGALVLVILGAVAFGVGLSNKRAIEQNNRRWCPMVSVLLPKPGEPAPDTERGRTVVANAAELYRDFGCA